MTNPFNEAVEEIAEKFAAKDKRIAELERDAFVKSNEANAATHRAIEMLLEKDERIAELENKQGIRDLEQQAKGIERVLCESSMSLLHSERMVLKRIMRQLREQAKRLKEQPNV